MEALLEKIPDWATLYGIKIVGGLAILIIGRIVTGILAGIVKRLMIKGKMDETLTKFITSLVRIGLLTFVFITALGAIGVQTASFIAIIGVAALAIGFALQGSLSNFASGVMLIIFHPFKSGDHVDAGGTSGTVKEIRIFSTILKTPDNKIVIVPNSKIAGENITNYSAMEMRRIDMVFSIGYDDDLRNAKKILEQIISEDERILKEPAPMVAVSELADSSVNFVVRPWAKTADYWGVYYDTTEKVKLTFDEKGISIPYPQQDVHMYQVPPK